MGRFWLILKVDLMGFADRANVGVKSFVLSKWVDGVALIGGVGIWEEEIWGDPQAHRGYIEYENPVNPLRGDVEGQLDLSSGAQGSPGMETEL